MNMELIFVWLHLLKNLPFEVLKIAFSIFSGQVIQGIRSLLSPLALDTMLDSS